MSVLLLPLVSKKHWFLAHPQNGAEISISAPFFQQSALAFARFYPCPRRFIAAKTLPPG